MNTATPSPTLTDRYVAAVVRGVPQKQRADIERELRTALADAIDDRMAAGADAKKAEHDAVLEFGDPIVLAAGYAGSPLHLIGPVHYADWKRLLTILEFIVVPIVVAVLAIVSVVKGESFGAAIGGAIWTAIVVGTQLAFWVTAMFAMIERMPSTRDRRLMTWTPDMLPDTSSQLTSRTEFIVETSFGALVATAFLLSPFVSPFADAQGAPIPFFDPWLWQTGLLAVLMAALVLQIGANAIKLRGRWTLPLAAGATLVDLAGAAVLIVLGATSHVLNPAFVTAAGWAEGVIPVVNVCVIGVGVLAVATSAWENFRSVRRV